MPAFEGLWGTASYTRDEKFGCKLYTYNYIALSWELLSVVRPLKTASHHDADPRRHWWHGMLSGWQPPVPPATTEPAASMLILHLPVLRFTVYLTKTAHQWVTRPLKTESHHDANHAATDDTVGCQGDNSRCHQPQQSRHHQCFHDISRSSVTLFI